MALRVLVVDDTVTYRKIVSQALADIPDVEVVGIAHHGKMALSRIKALQPDLITLDIDMPEMDGLEVLQEIRTQRTNVGVIIISALTPRGGEITIRALELGAFDFITKPVGSDYAQNRESIRNSLAPLLKAYIQRRSLRTLMSNARGLQKGNATSGESLATPAVSGPGKKRPDMVLIGVSTGGPSALSRVIPELPANLGVPVFVVQHMPAEFTRSLAERLNKQSLLTVKEAENDELAQPNIVYFAPGGKQMKLAPGPGANPLIQITDDPPENNCKPAADVLFRSAAQNFPGRACAVIMTGMGSDGTRGLRLLKEDKAWVIAQDEASCVIFGMPKEAIDAGVVDIITPLYAIAGEICKSIQGVTPE